MNPTVTQHFQKKDPLLLGLYEKLDLELRPIEVLAQPPATFFTNLCESIVSQQLSVKASDTIWKRFISLFPNQEVIPSSILAKTDDELRSVGISRGKAIYLKALSEAVVTQKIEMEKLPNLNNEEVIHALVQVKGIGQWTAEMFMMFTLGREDIFSLGDLGLKNAINRWYGQPDQPLTIEEIKNLITNWAPYKTYAAKILWRSLELPIDRS